MNEKDYHSDMVVEKVWEVGVNRLREIYNKNQDTGNLTFRSKMNYFFSTIKISFKLHDVEISDLLNLRHFCSYCNITSTYEKIVDKNGIFPNDIEVSFDKAKTVYNTLKSKEQKAFSDIGATVNGDGCTFETLSQIPYQYIRFNCIVEVTGNRLLYICQPNMEKEIMKIENAREGFSSLDQYLASRFLSVFREFSTSMLGNSDIFTDSIMYGNFFSYNTKFGNLIPVLSTVQSPVGEINFLGTTPENMRRSIEDINHKMGKEVPRSCDSDDFEYIYSMTTSMRLFLEFYMKSDLVIGVEDYMAMMNNVEVELPVEYPEGLASPMKDAYDKLYLVRKNLRKGMHEAIKFVLSPKLNPDMIEFGMRICYGLNCVFPNTPIRFLIKGSYKKIKKFIDSRTERIQIISMDEKSLNEFLNTLENTHKSIRKTFYLE